MIIKIRFFLVEKWNVLNFFIHFCIEMNDENFTDQINYFHFSQKKFLISKKEYLNDLRNIYINDLVILFIFRMLKKIFDVNKNERTSLELELWKHGKFNKKFFGNP